MGSHEANPYAPPLHDAVPDPPAAPPLASYPPFVAFSRGKDFVMSPYAPLPDVCVKCGARHDLVRRQTTFKLFASWAFLLLPFGCVLALVVIALTFRTFPLSIPLCRPCRTRWSHGVLLRWIWIAILVAAVVAPPVGLALVEAEELTWLLWPAIAFVAFIAFLVVELGVVRARAISVLDLDDQLVTLGGVHADARLAAWEQANLRAQMMNGA